MHNSTMPPAVVKADATIDALYDAWRRWQDATTPAAEDAALSRLYRAMAGEADPFGPFDGFTIEPGPGPEPGDEERAWWARWNGCGSDDDAPDLLALHTVPASRYWAEREGEARAAEAIEQGRRLF